MIETSSYQATDLWSAPPVVAVTSLHPDHLDWHGTAERYYADKLALCRLPGARTTIANGADPRLRERVAQLGPDITWVAPRALGPSGRAAWPAWAARLGLVGAHNLANALIARASLVALGVPGADDDDRLLEAAGGFEGLPARLCTIATAGGVRFVDDGLSTNVLPTIAALDAFATEPVALIVGGFDRGIDYHPLGDALAARRAPTLLLTVPDVGSRIAAEVTERAPDLDVVACADEGAAAAAGWRWAREGGVVLLSPAAPSYGRYHDYTERSAVFAHAARRCSPDG